MKRRDFIRQLIIALLVIVLGPRVRELVEWSEVDKLADELDGKWVIITPGGWEGAAAFRVAFMMELQRRDRSQWAQLLPYGTEVEIIQPVKP